MKIRFLFHKPIGERGIGKAIVAWTWLLGVFYNWKVLKYNYSHEELWIPDENYPNFYSGFGGQDDWSSQVHREKRYIFYGQCLSSTTRGDADGVRFAPASEVLKHPERWDYIECDVDLERLEVAMQEAKKLVGKKYDFRGIFGFVNPIPIQDSKKWYCSEICDWLKVLLGIYPKRYKRISPRRAAYILAKKYGEPKSLC
jgi:hypothetical protein